MTEQQLMFSTRRLKNVRTFPTGKDLHGGRMRAESHSAAIPAPHTAVPQAVRRRRARAARACGRVSPGEGRELMLVVCFSERRNSARRAARCITDASSQSTASRCTARGAAGRRGSSSRGVGAQHKASVQPKGAASAHSSVRGQHGWLIAQRAVLSHRTALPRAWGGAPRSLTQSALSAGVQGRRSLPGCLLGARRRSTPTTRCLLARWSVSSAPLPWHPCVWRHPMRGRAADARGCAGGQAGEDREWRSRFAGGQ